MQRATFDRFVELGEPAGGSHPSVWRSLVDARQATALVIGPNARIHPRFPDLLAESWPAAPDDWDVVCLGAYHASPPVHVGGPVFRPVGLAAVHGYAIRSAACAALLRYADDGMALERAFDLALRDKDLKIYSLWPNLICPKDSTGVAIDSFVSFSQLGKYGRLGNQMFQISATLTAGARQGYRAAFPMWDYASNFERSLDCDLDPARIREEHLETQFHHIPIPAGADLDVIGFFQSPAYFAGYEKLIGEYLRPTKQVREQVARARAALGGGPAVGVHVRRGDYLTMPERFRPLPIEYYRRAAQLLGERQRFLVFSDDPEWCRAAFAGWNAQVVCGNSEIVDLFLMAGCDHQIIANSSFSWWAAWLNESPGKRVIAPEPWFGPALSGHDTSGLLPNGWERVR